MSFGPSSNRAGQTLSLHPSVGLSVDPDRMSPRQKVAAVAKVRSLEHILFENQRVRRSLSPEEAAEVLFKVNQLRNALGWLEIGLDHNLRWPEHDDDVVVVS